MMILVVLIALLPPPALAQSERVFQQRYCSDMLLECHFPDGTGSGVVASAEKSFVSGEWRRNRILYVTRTGCGVVTRRREVRQRRPSLAAGGHG